MSSLGMGGEPVGSANTRPPRTGRVLDAGPDQALRLETWVQNDQTVEQFLQVAWVAPSFRDSPVANMESPPVITAAVALPPEMPFLFLTARW